MLVGACGIWSRSGVEPRPLESGPHQGWNPGLLNLVPIGVEPRPLESGPDQGWNPGLLNLVPIRGGTQASRIGSLESYSLDHQGSPQVINFQCSILAPLLAICL